MLEPLTPGKPDPDEEFHWLDPGEMDVVGVIFTVGRV